MREVSGDYRKYIGKVVVEIFSFGLKNLIGLVGNGEVYLVV